jgi:hypothetical protein
MLHYAPVDTARLPQWLSGDAFDITMARTAELAAEPTRRRAGALKQAGEGRAVAEQADAFRTFARTAPEGQCFGSYGRFSEHLCNPAHDANKHATAGGKGHRQPEPQFTVGVSGEECVRACESCGRCGFASFSLALRRCTWHPPERCNITRLERRWELWSYRTRKVRAVTDTS